MTVINMDCREGMATLAECSVDSVVTDPPYGLSKQPDIREVLAHWLNGDDYSPDCGGFMGKKWDSFVPGPLVWEQAFRVLKPGGYLVAFAGSRTVDLMAMSIRLAGFEIVDQLHWLYGTGFPKSMDVAKAVDARDGLGAKLDAAYRFTAWFRDACPLSSGQVDTLLGTNGMGRHYRDVPPGGKQPRVATRAHFETLRPTFTRPVPQWVEDAVDQRTFESENLKRRKVVGHHTEKAQAAVWRENLGGHSASDAKPITTAHSDEAKQWEGWGTALKPCHEPIVMARKPLDGTYADNLMSHGVGALNIDGCRNGERWPGNVLHDGCLPAPMDRYFYSAKATKADREAGLEDFEPVSAGEATGGRAEGSAGLASPRSGAGRTGGAKNTHPTVKPTDLMRWLCRLVTPPGGLVLDPFTGSGSTGRGAVLEGFDFVGFELSAEYAKLAEARIRDAEDEMKTLKFTTYADDDKREPDGPSVDLCVTDFEQAEALVGVSKARATYRAMRIYELAPGKLCALSRVKLA